MVYDNLTADVLETASALRMPPNELANRLIEGCLMQIQSPQTPDAPPPIVLHARRVLRRDLPRADRLLQLALEKLIDGWAERTQRWRTLLIEEVNAEEGSLTETALKSAVKRAEGRWKDEEIAARRWRQEARRSTKSQPPAVEPTQS